MLRITSKQDGFRRCGVAHPTVPTEYPDDHFSPKELKQLQAEPMLVVEIIANPKQTGKGNGNTKEKDKTAETPADGNQAGDQTAPAESAAAAAEGDKVIN